MTKAFEKLTRTKMRVLARGAAITEHGITFERLASGDGVFSVNIMVDGQRIHRVIGRESDGTTRTQAEDFVNKARQDAKHDRLALPKGRKVALSFREASKKYLARLQESGGKDIKAKTHRLNLHLVPFFGDAPLSKISSFDIERYKHQRQQEHVIVRPRGKDVARLPSKAKAVSHGTVNRELAALSHLLNMAVEWGWIDRRPTKIRHLAESEGRIIYLTVEQANRLVECAKADRCQVIYPFILIALETSLRLMSVLGIRKDNIDVARRVIYIPHVAGETKTGSREQPITQHLASFLERYMAEQPADTPWLFPSERAKSGHRMNVREPFRRVAAAAGLNPDVVVRHTMRHTAVTHLAQAKVDIATMMRISGHKTVKTVLRYIHQNGEHIQQAMDSFENRLKLAS